MRAFIILVSTLAVANAGGLIAPANYASANQYHAQDALGQYNYGYAGGPSSKVEARTADGIVRGGYNYIDANGLVQTVNYVADAAGFRVAATNLPVGPAPAAIAAPVIARAAIAAPVLAAPALAAPVIARAAIAAPALAAPALAAPALAAPVIARAAIAAPALAAPVLSAPVLARAAIAAPALAAPVLSAPVLARAAIAAPALIGAPTYTAAAAPLNNGAVHVASLPLPPADTPEVVAARAAHFAAKLG